MDDAAPIREWVDVDRAGFETEIVAAGMPAVIRGFASDWPVVRKAGEGRNALADYLGGFDADAAVEAFVADAAIGGRYFYSDDLKGFNFEKQSLTLRNLLDRLMRLADESNPPSVYAGAIPLSGKLEAICAQNPNPLLADDVDQLRSIWIGNRGRTATHWDLPQNIAVVCGGERTFTLFPPEQLPNLYIGPLDFTLAGQPISLVDLKEPDFDRFPRFKAALEHAQSARLVPGDALYLPSMWFHEVESHDPLGVLINYWWRDSAPYMFTPLFTLLHGLLSIRDLPEREREIWKGMFDHYLFQANGDPMEHIPEDARSIFQELTPERIADLRVYLLRSLGGVPKQ